MIAALLASGALKWIIVAFGGLAAFVTVYFKGKSDAKAGTAAQTNAQKAVDAAQANAQATQAQADASEAKAAVTQAKLDAVESRQNVEADTAKLTPEQVKDELNKDWSR